MDWSPIGEVNRDLVPMFFERPRIFRHRADIWNPYMECVDTTASNPATWDFLAALVAAQQAKCIVEAGTYRGHGTFAMAESVAINHWHDAHIWTADVEDHGVQAVLDATGLAPWVTVCIERFETMLDRITQPIDLAFIDASEEDNAMLRLQYVDLVLPKLAPNGIIVCDDSTNDTWEGAKMLRAQASLYLPVGTGLTLFQRSRT